MSKVSLYIEILYSKLGQHYTTKIYLIPKFQLFRKKNCFVKIKKIRFKTGEQTFNISAFTEKQCP